MVDIDNLFGLRWHQRIVCDLGLIARHVERITHLQPVFTGEIEVALIMARTAKDCAGAIVHQDEISDIDRQALFRVYRIDAGKAGIKAQLFRLLDRLFASPGLGAIGDKSLQPNLVCGKLTCQWVIRRNRHEAGPKQGVGTGREDL